jgi:hypothetical protein
LWLGSGLWVATLLLAVALLLWLGSGLWVATLLLAVALLLWLGSRLWVTTLRLAIPTLRLVVGVGLLAVRARLLRWVCHLFFLYLFVLPVPLSAKETPEVRWSRCPAWFICSLMAFGRTAKL